MYTFWLLIYELFSLESFIVAVVARPGKHCTKNYVVIDIHVHTAKLLGRQVGIGANELCTL